ncbi:unnamed protein product [Phytophthora lilii]|uniref:Unnamed protein product n=1 Tax=Phytophthora lilii TaxID=2077276 RepID=A0A9W6X389_9STRA|nr:unnamed protein product [Phytophthora lilii]
MAPAQYEAAVATFERLAASIECSALVRQQIRELATKMLPFVSSDGGTEKQKEPTPSVPPPASLDQILQHNYLYEEDENENPLWVDFKLIGNDYFKEKNYTEAIEAYSQGLEVAPNKAVLLGNRALCFLRLKGFERAREDAEDALDADNYENIKYYRLLSEAMMGMKDYDEAKEICDQGLELDPKDETLVKRRRIADAMIAKEKEEHELEKKRLEQEERAKVEAANAAAAAAAAEAAANPVQEEAKSGKNKTNKKKAKPKDSTSDIELVPMINYQEVSPKWIETHTRGSRRFETYQAGMETLVVGAKALLQVTDSIGTPGRSKLPLGSLVSQGMAYLRKAGEAGVAEAWFRLGVLYSSNVRKGIPLTPDPYKMMECFHKAAALRPFIKPPGNRVFPHQGVAEAENELGVCYRDGVPAPFVEANLEKAFHYFLRSAKHDYPMGQYHVARAYSTGSGTPVDAFAARMWASRAAQHGLPEAQKFFAELLKKGYGGKRDASQAREWTLTACQNQLSDLLKRDDFLDIGVTVLGGGAISEKFSTDPQVSQRGKELFQEFYGAYLDENDNDKCAETRANSGFDSTDIQITKVSSYTPKATSSSDSFYRPFSAVIDAEIQTRAKGGSVTAYKYLASEKLVRSAGDLLVAGDIKGALRDLKKADLIWELPKCAFLKRSADLLPRFLKEAAVSLHINPRDPDAAYIIGRWEFMSDQDTLLHWKRCVKMHPSEASFYFYLGTAYFAFERYSDAMDAMEAALAIEKKPDWLHWLAATIVGMGMIDPALSVYKEYVESYPPDERFIPDAYYSIGALYFKKYNNAMATVYHELGQMAESVTIRFPAFYPKALFDTAKETLRSGMKKNGYMESSVIASVMAQNVTECGFCNAKIKPTQLLGHKLSKCPRRIVVCQDCNDRMVFDSLQAHRQVKHLTTWGKGKKKKKGKRKNRATSTSTTPANETMAKPVDNVAPISTPIQTENFEELTSPKFHFAASIVDVSKGKSDTVFTLQTVVGGHRWTLRVHHNALLPTKSGAGFDVLKGIDEPAADSSVLVFWRRSPPLDMIDRRALAVPMKTEVYGKDVIVYILKCPAQALGFELAQLRYNKYMEQGSLCSYCSKQAKPGERLSTCSACLMTKYCSRDCHKTHWKRIHRVMCQNEVLLGNCRTITEDVTPDQRGSSAGARQQQPAPTRENIASTITQQEECVYVEKTLEVLEDILRNEKAKRNSFCGGPVEYHMLPPRDPGRPRDILGSVRIFPRAIGGSKEYVTEFCVGYLLSSPTLLQMKELHYFFQTPPHNPIKLKCDGSEVYLKEGVVQTDGNTSRGYRISFEMPLSTYSLAATAELIDYILSSAHVYLS